MNTAPAAGSRRQSRPPLQFHWDLQEARPQHNDRKRQGQRRIRQDHAGVLVADPDIPEQDEQGDDQQNGGKHLRDQQEQQESGPPAEVEPGYGIGGGDRHHQGQERGGQRDDQGIL